MDGDNVAAAGAAIVTKIIPGGVGLGVWWYVWGLYGFWWGLWYGMFWPAWVGFRLAKFLLAH